MERTKQKRARELWIFPPGFEILLFLCGLNFVPLAVSQVSADKTDIDWQSVHPEIREQVKAVTQSVSDILRVRPHEASYHRNGSDSVPYLSSRDYDHSFVASFTLRGVDKAGKQIPPDANTRPDDEYGQTLFTLRLRNLKELPPEEALTEMLEGRRLAEARHALDMRSFWIRYNLVERADDLKTRLSSLAKQARSAKDPKVRKGLNAKAKAQQQANQREIKTASETAKKQLEQIQPNLASAKEREKEWQTAQQLRLLDARESRLQLELAVRRQEHEESVSRLRETAAGNPKLQQTLGSSLANLEKSFGRFETRTNQQLEEVAGKRAGLKGERVVEKPSTDGRVADRRAKQFFRKTRKRKMGTLEGARFSLNYHPGPSKLTSKEFSVSTGEGLMLEVDSLTRRSLRSVAYYWPCGRYLVSITTSIQRSILQRARMYDGQHRRVPFLERRLDQAEAMKNSVAQNLNRSGLCDQNDGYWPWTKRYAAKAEENKSRIDEIKSQLDTLAKEKAANRAEWLELMRENLQRALPGEGTTILGPRVVKTHKQLRDSLRTEIRARHEEQRGLIQEAEKLLDEQLDLLEEQFEKSKKRRPQVKERLEALELERHMIRLELYDVARWYEPSEFPMVLREFEERLAELGVGKRDARWQFKEWMEAKWLLARAENLDERIRLQQPVHGRLSGSAGTWYKAGRLVDKPSRIVFGDEEKQLGNPLVLAASTTRQNALGKLRVLLDLDPGNLAVRKTVEQQEKRWLRRIAAKIEMERRASLDSFNQYLSNRGYDPRDSSGWWEGFKDYIGFAWGAGPITSMMAIPGAPLPWPLSSVFPDARLPGTSIPGSQAEATDRAQTRNAKHQMGLFAIMRLHNNGVPLKDIPGIAADAGKLAQKMVLKESGGGQMSSDKASKLGKDIRQTLVELDDLRALTLGDMDAFNKALAESHYETIDMEQSWGEFLGDALSPRNLLTTLGPSAVTRVGGKWQWVAKPKTFQKLTEGGVKVMRGRDSLVATMRLEEMGKWFEKGPVRMWLKKVVTAPFIHDQQVVANLKGWDAFVNSGSRMMAAMVIMGGGIHLAEQHGGPGGRLLAEALAELSAQEIAYDVLSRSGTPLRKLVGEVDEFGLVLVKKQAWVDDLRHALGELNAPAKGSAKVETRALEKLVKKVDDGPGTFVAVKAVPDTREQGLDHAIGGVVEALRKGDLAEAKEALVAAKGFAERLGEELPALKARVDKAKALLARARTRVKSLVGRERPAGNLKSLDDQGIPPAFIAEEQLYDLPGSGRYLDLGDDAFQRGDLEEAATNYRRARRRAKRHDQAEMVGRVDDRLALTAGTEKAGGILARLRKRTHSIEADKAITDGEIKELIGQFQKGRTIKTLPGGTSPVFEFADNKGRRYVFKQLGDSEEMAAESAASGLAQALGIKAPTARRVRMGKVKTVVEENGKKVTREIEAEGVLYRHIEGEKLSDLTEPVAAALKGDYAKQRVLRAWLADPDIHFGNHLLGGDAHLWALDFGKANLKRKQLVKIIKDGERYAEYKNLTTEKYLDFIMNIPHLDAYRKKLPQYAWMARMDDMVHYKDMVDTLEVVKKLVDGDGRELRGILEKSLPKSQVDEAFEVLRERARHLEEAMLKRFSRPSARLTKRAGQAVRPWTVREGEGLLPHTATEARPGKPMVLDPDVSKTYLYVVKEDGSIVYAPQQYKFWTDESNRMYRAETVKHTDLAEAGPAKIGGEIKFKDGVWYMDSQSGRYSAAKDPITGKLYGTRTKEELDAAVELARRSGTEQTIKAKFQ